MSNVPSNDQGFCAAAGCKRPAAGAQDPYCLSHSMGRGGGDVAAEIRSISAWFKYTGDPVPVRRGAWAAIEAEIVRLRNIEGERSLNCSAAETPEIPLNVIRYRVVKDAQDEFCLKACPDGDLTDWANYEALLRKSAATTEGNKS